MEELALAGGTVCHVSSLAFSGAAGQLKHLSRELSTGNLLEADAMPILDIATERLDG